MRILGRYLYPLICILVVVAGVFLIGAPSEASHNPGDVINPELYADPNPGLVNQSVSFTGNVGGHSANDPPQEGDFYTYYFWKHCPGGPTGAAAAIDYYENSGPDSASRCGFWDTKRENVNALAWNIGSFTYSAPGSYNPVIIVRQYPDGELYGNEIFFGPLRIDDLSDYMDVTPDDGTPSGSKSSESCSGSGCGPVGPATAAPGATENYSATFTSGDSGNDRGYRFYMYDPAGNIRDPKPSSGYSSLSSSPQTISNISFTFSYGSGVYRVCARGAQEDGLFTSGSPEARLDNKVFGWVAKLFGVAKADFTGVGASDVECKNVTVASVKLEAETAPGSGVWNDDSVTIPYDTSTNLRWSSGGITNCTASNASPPKDNWSGGRTSPGNQPTGNLIESTTYTIDCGGATDTVTVFVEGSPPPPPPPPPPGDPSGPYIDLAIDGELVGVKGGQVTRAQGTTGVLTWQGSGVRNCSASAQPATASWNGSRGAYSDPSESENLDQSRTYTITCDVVADGSRTSDFVDVYVPRAADVRLFLNEQQRDIYVKAGTKVDVRWEPRFNPTKCYVPAGWERGTWAGDKSVFGGTETFYPTENTPFRIRCENTVDGNTVGNTVTRNVVMSDAWTELYLNGDSGTVPITSGTTGRLQWKNGPGVNECRTLSGPWVNPGLRQPGPETALSSGEDTGVLNSDQTYILQCRKWGEWWQLTCNDASDSWNVSNACVYSQASVTADVEAAGELEVTLSASQGSGPYTTQDGGISGTVPLNGINLKADVFTTGSGDLTYTFFCDETLPGDPPIGPTTAISQLNDSPCNFSTAGVKTAKVIVQKGTQTDEDTIQINVTTPPSDSPILTNPPEPGPFCNAGQYLSYDFTWSDQDQTAWEIQIDEDANFGSPFPSSKTSKTPAGGSHTYTPVVGTLAENTSYYWRVRTWDEFDVASNWTNGVRFTTWPYKGPRVRWVITSPEGGPPYPTETQIVFDNTTIYYGGSNFTYLWEYDNEDPTNAPANSTAEDGNAIYTSIGDGNKRVRLTVTDLALGESCFSQNRINMGTGLNLPIFREIIPR